MFRILYFFLAYFLVALPAQASFSPKHYQLECGQNFGCPQGLHRRVHFWIDIFGRHSTNSAVFHDRDEPEKVYSVLTKPGACGGRSTPRAIENERSRIKKILLSIAQKKRQQKILSKTEKQLASLFSDESSAKIVKASKRIRCQSGNSTRFRKALKRFGAHRHAVSTALKEFGLPEGIQYLPFVESAYSPTNYSSAGAAGLWQLMPATASHLGLLVNPVIDERMDPEISTLAAIKYLQHSFEVLALAARAMNPSATEASIYPFVMTSYNFGLSGMLKAMNTVGLDFVDVLDNYHSNSFQVAVKNFYASFLAARHVATHADQFFSLLPENKPVATVSVVNNKARSVHTITRHFGLTADRIKALNPALTSAVWKGQHLIPKGFRLRLPKSTKDRLNKKIVQLNKLPADKPPKKLHHYRVRRGDTACGIAYRFKVSCKKLVRMNKLGKKAIVRTGRRLTIPGGSVILNKPVTAARTRIFGKHVFSANAIMSKPVKTVHNAPVKYTVAKGDTPCGIAKQNHISCQQLKQTNQINKAGKIYIGQTLTIPVRSKTGISKTVLVQNQTLTTNPADTKQQILTQIHYTSYLDRVLSEISITKHPQTSRKEQITIAQKQKSKPISLVLAREQRTEPLTDKTASQLKPDSTGIKQQLAKQQTIKPIKVVSKGRASLHVVNAASAKTLHVKALKKPISVEKIARSFGTTQDLHVTFKKNQGWTIRVATDETLGHYADWLDIGFSSPILKLNGIKSSRSVRIGKTIRLPIDNKITKRRFEEKRLAFHQNLQKQYLDQYSVTGKKQYRFQSGDNPWTIASSHQIPLWLLKRFNPNIFNDQHDVGNVVVLPVLVAQRS